MRILIYGLNYSPELTGIGKYTGEMAAWLAARGHDVHVVTAPPYYPSWKIHQEYRGKMYRTERSPGLPIVFRTPLYVPEKPTGLKRMMHLFSFMLGSIPVILREMFWKPDVVFTVEPTFFCAPLALLVAKLTGATSWLHIQDFEVDAAFDLELLPRNGVVHHVALGLERFFTKAFDRVSSISVKMLELSCAKGVPTEKAVLFPNWVDVEAIRPLTVVAGENTILRELGLEGRIVLLYSGNMGAKQGLEVLAPLARAFAGDPRVHFIFCGDGAFRPKLKEMIGGMTNVTLLPLQAYARLNELLNAADIHLLPQRAGASDLVMPSRLTGMLSSGRPVVAAADAGTQVATVVTGRGIVVPTENAEALITGVTALIDDKLLRTRLGAAAREYAVEYLGKERVLQKFELDLLPCARQRQSTRQASKLAE